MSLTTSMRYALALLKRADSPEGVVTAGATAMYDRQAWINYRTAHALAARGLVVLSGYGEDATVTRASNPTQGEEG